MPLLIHNNINISLLLVFKKASVINIELLILLSLNYILINIALLAILLEVDIKLDIKIKYFLLLWLLDIIFINILLPGSNTNNLLINFINQLIELIILPIFKLLFH